MPRFLSKTHEVNYATVADQLANGNPSYKVPADWSACLFLLTAHSDIWRQVSRYVDPVARLVDWSRIRRLDFSRGHRFLVQLAQYLYNGTGKVEWDCLWYTVDSTNFDLVMAAMQIRRHGEGILREPEVVSDAT